jgi:hypothetical protein
MSYYSQNDEERVILEYFGDKPGRFLDVGAFDGIGFSNTRKLLENGWSGVYVEPSADNILKLIKNSEPYADRVHIVQAAVSCERRLARFYIDTTPDRKWSTTINEALFKEGSVRSPLAINVWATVIRMVDLSFLGPYDFISLDAEWEDMGILHQMTLGCGYEMLNACRMICIEPRDEIERRQMQGCLEGVGFKHHWDTHENLLMTK